MQTSMCILDRFQREINLNQVEGLSFLRYNIWKKHLFVISLLAIYKRREFLLFGAFLPGEINYDSYSGLILHTDAELISNRERAFLLQNQSVYIMEIVLQTCSTFCSCLNLIQIHFLTGNLGEKNPILFVFRKRTSQQFL